MDLLAEAASALLWLLKEELSADIVLSSLMDCRWCSWSAVSLVSIEEAEKSEEAAAEEEEEAEEAAEEAEEDVVDAGLDVSMLLSSFVSGAMCSSPGSVMTYRTSF